MVGESARWQRRVKAAAKSERKQRARAKKEK